MILKVFLKSMWFRLYFFTLAKILVSASVFTLVKEKNVTCVLTEDSVDSGLYLSSINKEFSSIEDFARRPLVELTQWISDDWRVSNSSEKIFYPVEDIRWEGFEVRTEKIEINGKVSTFSLCFSKKIILVASDESGNIEMVTLSQKREPVTFCQWSHYILTENTIFQVVGENGTRNIKKVWKIVFKPDWLVANHVYSKIQEYNFRYSTSTSNKISYLDLSNVTKTKNLCIGMFVSVDVESELFIVLEIGNSNVSRKIEGFNRKDELKIWIKIEIETNSYEGRGKLYFYRRRKDKKRCDCGFWAIDKVHLCKPKTDFYQTQLEPKENQDYLCKTLKSTKPSKTISCKTGFFGENCEVNCGEIFGEGSFCEGHRICTDDGKCDCAWGYKGATCNKTCDSGFWGFNCASRFNLTRCQNYSSIEGCTKCKPKFFGNQCSEKFPVILEPPTLISIKEDKIEIFLKNSSHSKDESEPDFYQIQFKKKNTTDFQNGSDLTPYSVFVNRTFTIQGVSAAESGYQIRVIFIVQNNFFGEEVPTLTTYKKTLTTIRKNNTLVVKWNKPFSKAEIFLLAVNCNYSCSKNILSNLTTSETSAQIKNLENWRSCAIKLYALDALIDETDLKSNQNFSKSGPDPENCQNPKQNFEVHSSEKPIPVQNLSVFANTDDTIWIKWQNYYPNQKVEEYKITCENQNGEFLSNVTSNCDNWENVTCAKITDLEVNATYNITVQLKIFDFFEYSDPKIIRASTNFHISDAPTNIGMKFSSKPEEIVLTWDHPVYTYGPLEKFCIETSDDNNTKIYTTSLKKFQHNYNYTISVGHDKFYRISVFGRNRFDGKKATLHLSTLTPISKNTSPLIEWCFNDCFLLIPNQSKMNFKILVMENNKEITEEEILKKYKFLKGNKSDNNSWIVKTEKNSENDIVAEIGDSPYKAVSVKNTKHVMYFLFEGESFNLVAYSVKKFDIEEKSNKLAYILVIVVCIVATVLGYFLYIRRKSRQFCHNTHNNEESMDTELSLLPTEVNGDVPSSKIIKIENFENYLEFSLIGSSQLEEEFQSLPNEKNKSCDEALKEENSNKNKNRTYIPYDYTRVVLKDFEDISTGDYINASYVQRGPKTYIACQGPKFSTVLDFWRMIWQEEVEVIIMATNFTENDGSRNCAEYWSAGVNTECNYGSLTVKLTSENEYRNYYDRFFELTYSKKIRKIKHLQLKWNSSKPLYANDILPVVQHLNKISENSTTPIVVHSGFGVGRNGTLILCDLALQMAKSENNVNFYALLAEMRNQRPHMVNTVDKYILAHLTVLEFFMVQESPFKKTFSEILNTSDATEEQMKFLKRLYWHDKIIQFLAPQNEYLTSLSFTFVDGYRNHFLLFEQLSQNLMSEFWIKVKNENIKHILCLDELKSPFWPFSFTNVDETEIEVSQWSPVKITDSYNVTKLVIKNYDNKKKKLLSEYNLWFFELKNWTSVASVNLINIVINIKKIVTKHDHPILVMCQSGICSSGLFTILFHVLEKYQKELEVDICTPLRIMTRSHPQFSATSSDLKFIYDSVLEYFQNCDQYNHIYERTDFC